MAELTQMIDATRRGDRQTADQLLPIVYQELRRLAAFKLAGEKPGQTLSATALVHEAYLRLMGSGDRMPWTDERRFFTAAAEAMRRIILDNARRKRSQKRGRHRDRVPLNESNLPAPESSENLLDVDEALTRLAAADPEAAELVKLRYFVGLSVPEAAAVLNISSRSADRLWAYARAYLRDAISNA